MVLKKHLPTPGAAPAACLGFVRVVPCVPGISARRRALHARPPTWRELWGKGTVCSFQSNCLRDVEQHISSQNDAREPERHVWVVVYGLLPVRRQQPEQDYECSADVEPAHGRAVEGVPAHGGLPSGVRGRASRHPVD